MTVQDTAAPRQAQPVPDTPENVMQQLSMKGKVVVVNGASDGIGYAVAEAMAEAGGDVALWYNSNDAAISKSAHLTKQHNIRAKAYQVEVSSAEKIQAAINKVVEDFGKLDVFVANAGVGSSKPITEISIEEYRKVMSVNGEMLYIRILHQVATNFHKSTGFSIVPNIQASFLNVKDLGISS